MTDLSQQFVTYLVDSPVLSTLGAWINSFEVQVEQILYLSWIVKTTLEASSVRSSTQQTVHLP